MPALAEPFGLPADYMARVAVTGEPALASSAALPPDVLPLAVRLAASFGCTHLVEFGASHALTPMPRGLQPVCVGHGAAFEQIRQHSAQAQWIDCDLEQDRIFPLDPALLPRAGLLCANVLEYLKNPGPLLRNLRAFLERAPFAVLTTADRAGADRGPPSDPARVREWALPELSHFFESEGFQVDFSGRTRTAASQPARSTGVLVLGNRAVPKPTPAPAGFRVVAIMTAYNEADVIAPALEYLFRQGIEVYLLDNWSTDDTVVRARPFLGHGLIGIESFPAAGPTASYDWKNLLRRVEGLSRTLGADWTIHHDADQERESPWPGLNLRDALYHVDRLGFNCIDHVQLAFRPVDNDYAAGTPLGRHFRHFEFDPEPSGQVQRNAWKNGGHSVNLHQSGGHEVVFPGRKIFPFKFLQRHYPVRSQAHGERKVLRERQARWNEQERAQGWHRHYDTIHTGHKFLRRPEELLVFDPDNFHADYLVERLTGPVILPPQPSASALSSALRAESTPPPDVASALKPLEVEVVRLVRTHCGAARRILEVGCGTGVLGDRLKHALDRPYYAGIEADSSAAEAARSKLDRVYCAAGTSIGELNTEAGSFDVLIAVNGFADQAASVLGPLLGLLKPDGQIIAVVPNPQRLDMMLALLDGQRPADLASNAAGNPLALTLSEWQQRFRAAGLTFTQVNGLLDDGMDLRNAQETGNQVRLGKLTLADLTRDEVIRLFTRWYVIVGRRARQSIPAHAAAKAA